MEVNVAGGGGAADAPFFPFEPAADVEATANAREERTHRQEEGNREESIGARGGKGGVSLRALAALEEGVGEDEEEEEEEDATSAGGCIRSSSHGFLDRGPNGGSGLSGLRNCSVLGSIYKVFVLEMFVPVLN